MQSLNVTTLRTLSLLALVACGGAEQPPAAIRIDGSPGVRPLVAALADEYTRATGVPFLVGSGMGSSERAAAVADSVIDIAMASHGIDSAEMARRGLTVHEIARTAVVFAVNADVDVANVTRADVCDVLAGRIDNWNRLRGTTAPIAAFTRPPTEVDAEIARQHVECLRSLAPGPRVRVIDRPDSMAAALARTPGAFGVTSQVLVQGSGGRIRALQLDGVSPTAENIRSGAYPLLRSSFLVTRSRGAPHIDRFLAFLRDSAAQRVIMANGAVPALH